MKCGKCKKCKGEPFDEQKAMDRAADEVAKQIDRELMNILAGEKVVEDFGGYEESTLEKYEAFVKKRNYKFGEQ